MSVIHSMSFEILNSEILLRNVFISRSQPQLLSLFNKYKVLQNLT
jgi:hypothetical protein